MYTIMFVTLIIIIISSLFIFLDKSEEKKLRRCKELERAIELIDKKIEMKADFRQEYETNFDDICNNYRDAMNRIEYLKGLIKHLTDLIDAQEVLLKRLRSQNDFLD